MNVKTIGGIVFAVLGTALLLLGEGDVGDLGYIALGLSASAFGFEAVMFTQRRSRA